MLFNWLRYRIAKKFNRPYLRFVLFHVTERCNAKCEMCDDWKKIPPKSIDIEEFEKIIRNSKALHKIRSLALMGGESLTLWEDIFEAMRIVQRHCPETEVYANSNCILSDVLVENIKKIRAINPNFSFYLSLDGLEETHDKIRGVGGTFKGVMNTMRLLKEAGIKFSISYTIVPENYNQIYKTWKICMEKGASAFSCRFASTGAYFDNIGADYSLNQEQMKEAYKQLEQIGFAENFLIYGAMKHNQGERILPCGAGYFSVYVTPDLEVLPCTHCALDWTMGNLRDYDYCFERLLDSERAKYVRKELVDKCKTCINDVEFCATYAMEQFKIAKWLWGKKSLSWFLSKLKQR